MSKEATKQNSDKRTEAEKPIVLTVDELETVAGGPLMLTGKIATDPVGVRRTGGRTAIG